ncbi:hypothetical protein [Mucilaginibacter myungsuensis]|uniref:Lipoprotein n=1 Tax=Mucilaginibacter myungsuensis TaxID=649104 RepID=A0A929KWN4_9SPHI|nr:hypothetical protein [Mucilaginibacter myungsuensis]MBE9662547.1 hypothetical protein [Mucilaginibacter myungsuensis]MDN3597966.1 hypothetical protein [Mucilaginibacter myungsuensis]
MKRISILLLAIVALGACQTKVKSPGEDVSSITIKYTELDRPTMFRIACDRFDKYFPKPYTLNVVSKPAIDSVMAVLNTLERMEDEEPDVRAKILITDKSNKTDTVCVGVASLRYKQATYKTPEKLLVMIHQ